jgi:dihydrofolate reductase
MAKLIFSAITSLDGYIEDEHGDFQWAAPDEEVHQFVNDLERPLGTYLYGRRMYETMRYWETAHTLAGQRDASSEYTQIWQSAEKVVYSTTLPEVSTAKTRLERAFDPNAIAQMKATSERDIGIGGPGLAAHAFAVGLVDECQLFLTPVVVGGGKAALPDHERFDVELLDEKHFGSGVVYLRYHVLR